MGLPQYHKNGTHHVGMTQRSRATHLSSYQIPLCEALGSDNTHKCKQYDWHALSLPNAAPVAQYGYNKSQSRSPCCSPLPSPQAFPPPHWSHGIIIFFPPRSFSIFYHQYDTIILLNFFAIAHMHHPAQGAEPMPTQGHTRHH